MNNAPNLNRLEYFVAVVEEGSITAAARRLGISKAVVSKQLQTLEDELSVSLIHRTSRQMNLTETGRQFYQYASNAVGQAKLAFEAARQTQEKPSGTLRITAPVDFGLASVSQAAAEFVDRHKDVRIDLVFSDEKFDLVEANFDISFRTGWLKDSSYLARKLRDFSQLPLCTPGFRDSLAAPVELEHLQELPFVENLALPQPRSWTFTKDGEDQSITMQNPVISVDVTLAAKVAVMSGAAFSILPDFAVRDELDTGQLVPLLTQWTLPPGGIYAVFPPSRHRTIAAREFVDFMIGRLRTV